MLGLNQNKNEGTGQGSLALKIGHISVRINKVLQRSMHASCSDCLWNLPPGTTLSGTMNLPSWNAGFVWIELGHSSWLEEGFSRSTLLAVSCPDFFGHTGIYVSAVYLKGTEEPPLWFGALPETILEFRVSTIIFIIFWDFWYFIKLSFHHNWKDARLLLTSMVYTSCLTSCRTT